MYNNVPIIITGAEYQPEQDDLHVGYTQEGWPYEEVDWFHNPKPAWEEWLTKVRNTHARPIEEASTPDVEEFAKWGIENRKLKKWRVNRYTGKYYLPD